MDAVVILRCSKCGLKYAYQGTIDEAEESAKESGWNIADGSYDCGCEQKGN